MSNKPTLRTLCVSRITPIVATLAFTLGSHFALADAAGGQALIASKVTLINPKKNILNASAAELIAAYGLAIEDTTDGTLPAGVTSVTDLAAGVLLPSGGKVRKDKDKVAPQIIVTTELLGGLSNADFALAVKGLYGVNGGAGKTALTAAGKANTLYAAVLASDSASGAQAIGTALGSTADLLSVVTASGKIKNSPVAGTDNLESFFAGAYGAGYPTKDAAEAFAKSALATLGASPETAEAVFGGLIKAFPGVYTTPAAVTPLVQAATGNKKLAKDVGAVVAGVLSDAALSNVDRLTVADTLLADPAAKTSGAKALIVQGILRSTGDGDAAQLTTAEVATLIGKIGVADTAKGTAKAVVAGALALGNGNNDKKLTDIINKLLTGSSSVADIGAITAAAVNSVGLTDPQAAETIGKALALKGNPAGNGAAAIAKVKVYSAGGYLAAGLADGSTSATAAGIAAAIMAKTPKGAVDVAYRIADKYTFDDASAAVFVNGVLATNKKIAQSAAVGVSLSDPERAGVITASAIVSGGDKTNLKKAATIAGAVASVGTIETASFIALEVGKKMANTPTGTKPIKLSLATALATSLAKAIQVNPSGNTKNRMDELGELGAVIASTIVQGGAPAATEAKLLAAAGSAIIKQLAKTVNASLDSKFIFAKADLSEVTDIAGSIALGIKTILGSDPRVATLLAADGALAKALAKAAGKTAGPNVATAFALVLNNQAGAIGFEDGVLSNLPGGDFDPETDHRDN